MENIIKHLHLCKQSSLKISESKTKADELQMLRSFVRQAFASLSPSSFACQSSICMLDGSALRGIN